MGLFPMFVKLNRRRCLVVGAGTVAESKIESLLAAGASVHVVAPSASEAVQRLARAGRITWDARRFTPADLEDVFLVVAAATSCEDVNAMVAREARVRGVMCNVVDDPERCDFYYPAVVRRGQLQIAISTGGRSPALAQRLRQELEQQYGPEYEEWLEKLGFTREKLLAKVYDPERRKRLLRLLASPQGFQMFLRAASAAHGRRQ